MELSWLAVVVAIVVGMAIAMVWYSDWGLFGVKWRRLTGVTPADSARVAKSAFVTLLVSIVATALTLAAAVAVASAHFDSGSVWLALAVGLVAWIGLSLSTLAQHNGFEMKPATLTLINSAYQLVLFLGMAGAIGLLQ